MEQQGSGYIKDYSAEMSTFFDPSGKQPTEMYFYFGPNHYKTLKALDKGRAEKWGTEQTGLSGLAADSLDQPVYHDQRIRLAVRLGLEHGYRTVDSDDYGEGAGLPCYLENIHVFCQDAY